MRIARITVYAPVVEAAFTYELSMGRLVDRFDVTIVKVEASDGTVGWGEVCPFGARYSEAHAEGARAALKLLAPALLGADPLEIGVLLDRMALALSGHGYAKAALEMACWDASGKALGQPLYRLFGGRRNARLACTASVASRPLEEMIAYIRDKRAQGYRQFSAKIDGDKGSGEFEKMRQLAAERRAEEFLSIDANTSLTLGQAAQLVAELRDQSVFIEQPCRTYEACLSIRRRTDLPFILDESIDSPARLYQAHADKALDVLNLKISRIGGLSVARHLIDFCAQAGIDVWIEDTSGTGLTAAAIAHLASATPAHVCLGVWYPPEFLKEPYAESDLVLADGHLSLSGERPGLGAEPKAELVGTPWAVFE